MPAISKVSLRRQRHDQSLLRVVVLAAGIIAIGIIIVPWTILDMEAPPPLPDAVTNVRPIQNPIRSAPVQVPIKKSEDNMHSTAGKEKAPEEMKGAAVEISAPTSGRDKYHTVFSTGCSTFQDWQSYVFFYHLLHSGQEGPVTRIASGCNDEDTAALTEIFENEIATMAPGRFRLHLTPDFSTINPGAKFKYVRTTHW
jgi:hypothetical protein